MTNLITNTNNITENMRISRYAASTLCNIESKQLNKTCTLKFSENHVKKQKSIDSFRDGGVYQSLDAFADRNPIRQKTMRFFKMKPLKKREFGIKELPEK